VRDRLTIWSFRDTGLLLTPTTQTATPICIPSSGAGRQMAQSFEPARWIAAWFECEGMGFYPAVA
jgi:hypothetical protein